MKAHRKMLVCIATLLAVLAPSGSPAMAAAWADEYSGPAIELPRPSTTDLLALKIHADACATTFGSPRWSFGWTDGGLEYFHRVQVSFANSCRDVTAAALSVRMMTAPLTPSFAGSTQHDARTACDVVPCQIHIDTTIDGPATEIGPGSSFDHTVRLDIKIAGIWQPYCTRLYGIVGVSSTPEPWAPCQGDPPRLIP